MLYFSFLFLLYTSRTFVDLLQIIYVNLMINLIYRLCLLNFQDFLASENGNTGIHYCLIQADSTESVIIYTLNALFGAERDSNTPLNTFINTN